MRIFNTILQDIRYQFKYGFYFIYAIMVLFYTILIGFVPESWRHVATAVILFIDPAALGFFFIGGILLLEKNERILDVLFVTPLRLWEYILSKAVSLSLVSVLSGMFIGLLGPGINANIPVLTSSLMISSVFYTLVGIASGIKAKTVNQYMIITIPAEILLSAPPVLLLFGIKSAFLEIMPGSLVLRLFQWCTGHYTATYPLLMLLGLLLWIVPAFYFANRRMKWFLSNIGGAVNENCNQTV